jgi:hypothetical protein
MPFICSSPATYAVDLAPGHLLEVTVCGETRIALEALIICGRRGFTTSAAAPAWRAHTAKLRRLGVPIATTHRPDPSGGLLAVHALAVPVRRPAEAA